MKNRLFLGPFLLLFSVLQNSFSSICSTDVISIDFTDKKLAPSQAYWTNDGILNLTNKGLGWDGDENSRKDIWIISKAKGLGESWRPCTSTRVRASVLPSGLYEQTSSNSWAFTEIGQMYVRHSPDRKSWSEWQALDFNDEALKQGKGILFEGNIDVPHVRRKKYLEYREKYIKTDPPWQCDEEALVRYILQREPTFFKRHKPFIGYVQLLYEISLRGDQRIANIQAEFNWGISGLASIPKDKDIQDQHSGSWRFKNDTWRPTYRTIVQSNDLRYLLYATHVDNNNQPDLPKTTQKVIINSQEVLFPHTTIQDMSKMGELVFSLAISNAPVLLELADTDKWNDVGERVI